MGGPSRFLAETCGCKVEGIDLSHSFVEAATYLAERSGLRAFVAYRQASALSLPFTGSSFDIAWTQHVAMNVADRAAFYREAFRVLKPGGKMAIYDVITNSDAGLLFPVPWAATPDASFLVSADEMRRLLENQGFRLTSWVDCTNAGISWFHDQERANEQRPPTAIINLQAVMGTGFPAAVANLRRNLESGRAALAQIVCDKP